MPLFYLDCPVNFLKDNDLKKILGKNCDRTLDRSSAEVLVVNPGTDSFLDSLYFKEFSSLKCVCTPSTGVNHLDTEYLEEKNIPYFCLLDDKESLENIHASAEFTWIHIMNLFRKFTKSLKRVDLWRDDENEKILRSRELFGKNIGIVGMGRIGNKIAKYAEAFGLNIFYYDPYSDCNSVQSSKKVKSLKDLESMDIISINCYLTEETREMITFGVWDNISSDSVIVNTSRGEVVDEDYVEHLVLTKNIKYGCDVLQSETSIEDLKKSKILTLSKERDSVIVSPHVAGATIDSQRLALTTVVDIAKKELGCV